MSEFGRTFTRCSQNPLLTVTGCDPWDAAGDPARILPGAIHPSVLYFPDGVDGYKFWMIFTPAPKLGTYPEGIPKPSYIGTHDVDWWWERCTLVRSHNGIDWEKTGDYTNPLISPGEPGSWEENEHCDPDVIYTPDQGPGGTPRWFLYYSGSQRGKGESIGLAISDDGLHYEKVGVDGPDRGRVFEWGTVCPAAYYDEAARQFHMWYSLTGTPDSYWSRGFGYATSSDGINWTPYNPNRPGEWGYSVLRPMPGSFDAHGITHLDVIAHDSQYWMYYHALPNPEYAGLQFGHATSIDGIHWTRHGEAVLTPGTASWECGSLYRPSPVVVGNAMYLYYTGITSDVAWPLAGGAHIGVAFSGQTQPGAFT